MRPIGARLRYSALTNPIRSNRLAIEPLGAYQLANPLAGVEHTGLYRIDRHPDDLNDLIDRLAMIIDEVDDFAMGWRQLGEALLQQRSLLLLLHADFRIVGRVLDEFSDFFIEFLGGTPTQHGKGLVARHRKQPGRYLGASLKPLSLPPNVEENLAHHILRQRFVV